MVHKSPIILFKDANKSKKGSSLVKWIYLDPRRNIKGLGKKNPTNIIIVTIRIDEKTIAK